MSSFKTSRSAPVPRSLLFLQEMSEACERCEAGFHFEEGGCWAMAAALQEEIGGSIQLRSDGFTHVHVEKDGIFFDHTGVCSPPTETTLIEGENQLKQIASRHGIDAQAYEADKAWAKQIIAHAKTMHLDTIAPSLVELSDDAMDSIFNLLTDEQAQELQEQGEMAIIQRRYANADCDDFALALHAVSGWPIAAIASSSCGPIHRLNIAPDGSLVDIFGHVSMQDLSQRYGLDDLHVMQSGCDSLIDSDEELARVVAVLTFLKTDPFPQLHQKAKEWLVRGEFLNKEDWVQSLNP